jgi:signal transduction histidine kinase/ActR/RegA family two-component response regulator
MRFAAVELRGVAQRAAASPARRWRTLPLTVQLMLLGATMVLAWILMTRAYDHVTVPQRDGRSRVEHWQQAERIAERVAAAAYEMQGASRGYALTGDSARLWEANAAEARHGALLDSLDQLARVDRDMGMHVAGYRRIATRWRAALRKSVAARDARRDARALIARERPLSDSARAVAGAVLEEMRAREHMAQVAIETRLASRESFLLRVGPIVTALLLLGISGLLLRRTLLAVSQAARALAEGRYSDVRLPAELGGNREMRKIADTFEELALAIEGREQILQSDILQLREYEQLKSDFVSTVSHELRTPLTSMRGALGLVLSGAAGPLSPQGQELLRIANQNTERLIRLINDILDIEKIESGSITVRRDRCDLRTIIEATIAGVHSYAVEQRVRIALRAPVTADVIGDQDRLIQVFTNLLSNAIKFSPGEAEVAVAIEVENETARVTVRDQGPGIPEEFQGRIFGKFQQADHSSSRRHGGTGLGLAIARAIVERHEGHIRFQTASGAGTTFVVELPCFTGLAPSLSDENPSVPHVLVVDGDRDIARILQSLASPTAVVVPATSRDEALRTVRERTIDAVIIEPELAGAGGFDLVHALRSLRGYSDLPVIVFSAREYTAAELNGVTLTPAHAYVKARDDAKDVVMRLKAVLAARVAVRNQGE